MGKGARKRAERKQEVAEFRITPAQHKAMMCEINAQIMKKDLEYYLDMDAAVLWALHEEFGFGAARLRRFFESFSRIHENLRKYYDFEDTADTWLCRRLLKERVGVDVAAWEKELEQSNGQ